MARTVKIFKPAKTAMQSGKANMAEWVLEFEAETGRTLEPLMGWTSSRDTQTQVRLRFPTKEAALAYAEQKGYRAVVEEPQAPVFRPKSYADNFRPDRIRR